MACALCVLLLYVNNLVMFTTHAILPQPQEYMTGAEKRRKEVSAGAIYSSREHCALLKLDYSVHLHSNVPFGRNSLWYTD
jgi:hypothetical protein